MRLSSFTGYPVAYFVYVLANPEGKIYIGRTNDLSRRLAQHNDVGFRGTLHTKRHPGPWRLLYSESLSTRNATMRRERELKSDKGREWIRNTYLSGC